MGRTSARRKAVAGELAREWLIGGIGARITLAWPASIHGRGREEA